MHLCAYYCTKEEKKNPPQNKFVCPFDNKEFVKLSSLRWHITLHHDQRKDIEPVVTTPVLTLKYSTFPDGTRQKDIIVNDKVCPNEKKETSILFSCLRAFTSARSARPPRRCSKRSATCART